MRAQLEKKLAQKEKEKKEDSLRQLAQRARDERAGIRQIDPTGDAVIPSEMKEREELRAERHRERARERNIQRAGVEKRGKLQRERERDISEQVYFIYNRHCFFLYYVIYNCLQIALGLPAKTIAEGGQFDQRLFNTTKGMDSGNFFPFFFF